MPPALDWVAPLVATVRQDLTMTHGRLRTPVVRGWDRLYSAQRMCLSVRRGIPNRLREGREERGGRKLLHRNPG